MTDLATRVEEYLTLRRALGFKLERAGELLAEFVEYAASRGAETISTELAMAWATGRTTSAVFAAQRMGTLRCFARWLHTLEPATEVPARDLLSVRIRRRTPYLYSDNEVAALMAAAREMSNPLRAATFETFIGLLSVTGMRSSEAMALDDADLDLDACLLEVRLSKFKKSRLLPLHDSTVAALENYRARRAELCPRRSSSSLFVSLSGTRLCHSTVEPVFRRLAERAGIVVSPPQRQPRLHDVRHSFAVRTLVSWYEQGVDVQANLPILSTFLGHVDPGASYWYLTAAPELLGLAARRLEAAFENER